MVKAKIPLTTPHVPASRAKRSGRPAPTTDSSLLVVRLKELDREFARQTKQLTALAKKLGKKLNEPINLSKPKKR